MRTTEEEKAYMHWLCQAAGTGSREFLRGLAQLGVPWQIYEWLRTGRLEEKISRRYRKKVAQMAEFTINYDVAGAYRYMTERGIRLVTEEEGDFPQRLSRIPDPPYALYYVGSLPPEEKRAVALIGARNCTAYGRYMAQRFGAALAAAGLPVISGMARGIDGIGQWHVLREGGYSLGVLGCGVDICYPGENRELYEMLVLKGGLCSEYPPGTRPRSVLFPPRNRIISGFCDAVLVIEAQAKSGTLITVDMALEQGREVYALPGRATDPFSSGCNRLIRQGAGLVSAPEELLEELMGGPCAGGTERQTELVFLEGVGGELLSLLDFYPLPAEELQRRYEEKYAKTLPLPLLFQELLRLCAEGHARQVGGSYFERRIKEGTQ